MMSIVRDTGGIADMQDWLAEDCEEEQLGKHRQEQTQEVVIKTFA